MLDWSVVSEIGRRPYMEDAYYLRTTQQGRALFCGIFDGHGGEAAAKYTHNNLYKFFLKALAAGKSESEAFMEAFELTSNRLKDQDSGTTAITFYLKNYTLFWANAGDSRLIVISKSNAKQLTEDHRLTNPKEYRRVLKAGVTVEPPYVYKNGYGLMPTRTLGDEFFKGIGIISTPQTGSYQLTAQDKWLVAGTDGLFDVISNDEIAQIVKDSASAKQAAEALKAEVLVARNASDNLTFVVLNTKMKS